MDDKPLDLLFDHFYEHEKEEGRRKRSYNKVKNGESHPFDTLVRRIFNRQGKFNENVLEGISKIIQLKEQQLRASSRRPIAIRAFIHKHKNNKCPLKAKVICIGAGGFAIHCRGPRLALNETVTLECFGNRHILPFNATCRVRHVSPCGSRTGVRVFGLEFIKISSCSKTKIKKLLG